MLEIFYNKFGGYIFVFFFKQGFSTGGFKLLLFLGFNMAKFFGTVFFKLIYLESDCISSPQRGSEFSTVCNLGL